MFKYFCENCGARFMHVQPERDENGLINDIFCPHCGDRDIYPDTSEGAAQSIRNLNKYEASLMAWAEKD